MDRKARSRGPHKQTECKYILLPWASSPYQVLITVLYEHICGYSKTTVRTEGQTNKLRDWGCL